MRVLVTGAHGFIGRHVVAVLQARGDEVLAYDHPRDVRWRQSLRVAAADADGIVNLAGVLGTAEIIGAEREAAEVNILGALNVLDVAARFGIPVVQIATGHEGQPNPYAITKRCATELALSRARWTAQPVTVVRAYHVYGPGQKMCPPHGTSSVRKVVPSFVARALTGMPLEVNGSGRQLVDLVHVSDVAKVLVEALDGPYGEVVEAGTGKPTTVLQAAEDVIEHVGASTVVMHMPMRLGEPEEAEVVAAEPLCLNPWPYLLDETIDWYRENLAR